MKCVACNCEKDRFNRIEFSNDISVEMESYMGEVNLFVCPKCFTVKVADYYGFEISEEEIDEDL